VTGEWKGLVILSRTFLRSDSEWRLTGWACRQANPRGLRETDFGRQRRRAPIRFRTVFVSRGDRERATPNRGNSRVFREDGELGVSAGLRGGAGRTRTGNQTVISPSRQVPNPARTNTASKMVAERTGILLRTER
jgi:hypothetical protein